MKTALRELPPEQLAPFDVPTDRDVEATREAIERHKRRLNEASPIRPYHGEGTEL